MNKFSILKNKYFISILLFIVWMLFFDVKDWSLIRERTVKLQELEKSEERLTQQIEETKQELHLLKKDAHSIETYAREKYYMKKPNEDLYIINNP